VGCRTRRPRAELVRLAVADGHVRADLAARLPGRGAWCCPDRACAEAAVAREGRALRRALRLGPRRVTLDGEALRDQIAAAGGRTADHANASRSVSR